MKTINYIDSKNIQTFKDLCNSLRKDNLGIRIGNIIMIKSFPIDYDKIEYDRIMNIIKEYANGKKNN